MPEIVFPFSGFCDTEHDAFLERALEDVIQDQNGDPRPELQDLWEHVNYGPVRAEYGKAYIEAICALVRDNEGIELDIQFKAVESPREYNFTNDKLIAEISEESVQAAYAFLQQHDGLQSLEAAVHKKFTAYSGFCPFYKNSLKDDTATDEGGSRSWEKPVAEWDEVQLGILLEVFFLQTCEEGDLHAHNLLEGCGESWIYDNLDPEGQAMLNASDAAMRAREEEE